MAEQMTCCQARLDFIALQCKALTQQQQIAGRGVRRDGGPPSSLQRTPAQYGPLAQHHVRAT